MDVEDIGKFLTAIQGSKYEYPLFVAVFTGLRQGELLGLTWDCVDFENGLLLINKQHNRVKGDTEFRFASLKNDKALVLTVADEVMEVLNLQKRRQEVWAATLGDGWSNPDNLVFTTEFGRYINNKVLYRLAASQFAAHIRHVPVRRNPPGTYCPGQAARRLCI